MQEAADSRNDADAKQLAGSVHRTEGLVFGSALT